MINDKIKCKVPFGTMTITKEARTAVNNALSMGRVTNGTMVRQFEDKFAEKFGASHAIAVSSGTDANTLALGCMHTLGAERGDEIIIPALTFVATANAVVNAGFKPVFVDVNFKTLNIDTNQIEGAITERTRAIMPVHLMGKPANMDAIMDIAKRKGINVIEDAAEAHGAKYKGQYVGNIAPIGCFSLYAAHIISSIEGGMILTNNDFIADTCRSLRNHGMTLHGTNWTFDHIGFSSKMNELEAAVGLGNLDEYEHIIGTRRKNFFYLRMLMEEFSEHLYTIDEGPDEVLSPHAFPIIVRPTALFTKYELVNWLNLKGIDNRNLFYSLPTQTKCYAYLGHRLGQFPNAEYLSNYGTHIGIHQDLTISQLEYVADCIRDFIGSYKV